MRDSTNHNQLTNRVCHSQQVEGEKYLMADAVHCMLFGEPLES